MMSNEFRPSAKYQPLSSSPSLDILQPTLDAVAELRVIFTSPDDSSSQYCLAEVMSHFVQDSTNGIRHLHSIGSAYHQ
jgi:hypothetical protein